jgi:hypothetical protein
MKPELKPSRAQKVENFLYRKYETSNNQGDKTIYSLALCFAMRR